MNMVTKVNKYDFMILAVLMIIIVGSLSFSVTSNVSYIPVLGGVPIPNSCFIKTATGYPCPTCGMTRSFIFIGHGDFVNGLRYNFGGIFAYVLCLTEIAYLLLKVMTKITSRYLEYLRKILKVQFILTALVILLSWLYINFIYY